MELKKLGNFFVDAVDYYHRHGVDASPDNALSGTPLDILRANYKLWHEEDKARRRDTEDSIIASVKRTIDKLNQKRNDFIEKFDDEIDKELVSQTKKSPGVTGPGVANSETPGSIVDRLSILALRIYHMDEDASRKDVGETHRKESLARLDILKTQCSDLQLAFDMLLSDLESGRKILKTYRQFKMYNDPTRNPEVYNSGESPPSIKP